MSQRFRGDLAWNVVSLAVSAACGIALNYAVSAVYGADRLGVFNQVLALYFLFSQLAALGVHYSALQEVAATEDARERTGAATSALVITAGLSAIVAAGFWALAPVAARAMDSPDVARGVALTAPGLVCFALDKVALGCINGAAHMRAYAVLSGSRFVLMLAGFGVAVAIDLAPANLPVVVTIAEAGTLIMCLVAVRSMVGPIPGSELAARARRHLRFGLRGAGSGILAEVNTRVDLLLLGAFASDAVVGAYSFAAMLAEGAFQLLVVLRTNYAPVLTRMLAAGDRDALLATVRRGRNRTYAAAFAIGVLAVAGYALVVPRIASDPAIAGSWPLFGILIAGMVSASGYVPFNQMMLYARRPGWQTISVVAMLAVNVAANLALIPTLGALGAATGAAVAFASSVAILLVLCRRFLDLPI